MFNFRIINTPDGNQVIDPSLKTPFDSLTPLQMVEYTEMDKQMVFMARMEQKRKMQQKRARNPFYRLACACGLV